MAWEIARRTHIVEGRHIGTHEDRARDVGQEILVCEVRMTLLKRLQILLPHTPPVPWPTVDLPGTIHRQARRFILEDEPFHPIDVRLVLRK